MQLNEFQDIMKMVENYFGKTLTSAQAQIWFNKVKWLNGDDAKTGADGVIANERYFPTPAVFLKFADEAKRRRAERELLKDRQQAKEFFNSKRYGKELSKDCVILINSAFAGKKTGREVAKGMYALDEIYPNIGFKENAKKLERELANMGR